MITLGSKQRLGLDIGAHSIKIVVLEKSGQGFRIAKHIVYPIYSQGETFDPEGPKRSVVVPRLMSALMELGITPRRVKHVGSSIGGQAVAAKEIKSIQMTDEEMDSSLLLEARKHLPLDGSETIVDYQILGDDPTEPGKVRVLLVAATRRYFQNHLEMLRDVELKPGLVDIDQLATLNAYITQNDMPDEGVIISLNIGCRKTSLSAIGRRSFFFTRDIPIAGYAFTQELMKRYGLTYDEAEQVKATQGLKPDLPLAKTAAENGLQLAEKGALDRLGDEINRSLRYYVKESGVSYFNSFMITGGSAFLPGINEYFEKKFNLTVTTYNPTIALDTGGKEIFEGPQLAAAIGLALRAE